MVFIKHQLIAKRTEIHILVFQSVSNHYSLADLDQSIQNLLIDIFMDEYSGGCNTVLTLIIETG